MRPGIYKGLLLLFFTGIVCPAVVAQTIIVFPKVTEPVNRIYTEIIKGIGHEVKPTRTIVIDGARNYSLLQTELHEANPEHVIALGRKAAERVVKSGYQEKMIVGATLFAASDYNGVSLAIDSRILLAEIKSKIPGVKRVFVVDSIEGRSINVYPESWKEKPTVITRYHKDPSVNSRILWQLLNEEAIATDAIVIPSHLDKDILYEIVQLAWEKKIILLSTNLSHLKEGVLMVFYPDNEGMGNQIGALVTGASDHRYESLRKIHVALNQTIAAHLGFVFDRKTLDQFTIKVK